MLHLIYTLILALVFRDRQDLSEGMDRLMDGYHGGHIEGVAYLHLIFELIFTLILNLE